MNPTLKLGLMVCGTLAVLWAFAWLSAEIINRLTKDDK
jgi:hypothetical protein